MIGPAVGAVVATVRHAITHHRIVLRAHAATAVASGRLAWFALGAATPWTTTARKVFAAAIGADATLRAPGAGQHSESSNGFDDEFEG